MPITSREFAKLSYNSKDQARGLVRFDYCLVEKERASRPAPLLVQAFFLFSSVSALAHTVNILVTGVFLTFKTSSPRCTSVTRSTSVVPTKLMGETL